jgi:hypothetical protein
MVTCANCAKEINFGYYFGSEGKIFCGTCTANSDIHELAKDLNNVR